MHPCLLPGQENHDIVKRHIWVGGGPTVCDSSGECALSVEGHGLGARQRRGEGEGDEALLRDGVSRSLLCLHNLITICE